MSLMLGSGFLITISAVLSTILETSGLQTCSSFALFTRVEVWSGQLSLLVMSTHKNLVLLDLLCPLDVQDQVVHHTPVR